MHHLKQLIPIGAVLARYPFALRRRGSELVGCCPLHGGSHDRQFVVSLSKNVWRCFAPACGRGGSIIDLVAALQRLEPHAAAERLAAWFALPYEPRSSKETALMPGTLPTHRAYTVKKINPNDEDEKALWTRIGSAWLHHDLRGINIVLDCVPIDGRVVLREWTPDEPEADAAPQKKKRSS